MTNEEAREILQQIRKQKCVSECDYGCKLYESETFCLEEKALDMAIKALEQTRWIPVSKPPKKSGEYLLDSEDFGIYVGDYDADMKSFGWWREDYEYDPDTIACIGREFIKFEGVLAWMPLPQPYEAESEDKE